MKKDKWLLAKCIAVPLLVGVVAAFITAGGMQNFDTMKQPPLSPPGFLFPIVWSILYTLMGIASYLVITSEADSEKVTKALKTYIYQLIVNFLWPTFFFNFEWYFFSFLWILLLWILIFIMFRQFSQISKRAGYLIVPYLLWVTFAAYLNLGNSSAKFVSEAALLFRYFVARYSLMAERHIQIMEYIAL